MFIDVKRRSQSLCVGKAPQGRPLFRPRALLECFSHSIHMQKLSVLGNHVTPLLSAIPAGLKRPPHLKEGRMTGLVHFGRQVMAPSRLHCAHIAASSVVCTRR